MAEAEPVEQLSRVINDYTKSDPGKSHLAESRSSSATLQAANDRFANPAPPIINLPKDSRKKRGAPEEIHSKEKDSSANSGAGHQSKKTKFKKSKGNAAAKAAGDTREPVSEAASSTSSEEMDDMVIIAKEIKTLRVGLPASPQKFVRSDR